MVHAGLRYYRVNKINAQRAFASMPHDVFISYRRSDQPKAELLHRLLKERGIDAWYDAQLTPGEDWRARTVRALIEAPVFVLLFSRSAAQSDEIVKELSAATMQKKIVIPVRLEDIQPEGAFLYELASRNWFDAFENPSDRFVALADRIAGQLDRPHDVAAVETKASVVPQAASGGGRRPGLAAAGATALIAAAALSAFFWKRGHHEGAGTQSHRIAFFGFTAIDDDAAAKQIAAAATDETYVNLAAHGVNTVARADAKVAPGEQLLDRAGKLGADFAMSSDVRRDGKRVRFALRLEDVSSRTTLWEGTETGAASTVVPTAYSASDRLVVLSDCMTTNAYTGSGTTDRSTLALVATGCGAITTTGGTSKLLSSLREMIERDLGGPDRNAAFAEFASYGSVNASPGQRATQLEEAAQALARARQSRPTAYATANAQQSLALATGRPPLEWIPDLERSLRKLPTAGETFWYARASRSARGGMLAVGRVRDAVGYAKAAYDADSTTTSNVIGYAVAMAASGEVFAGQGMSWDDRVNEEMQTRPDIYKWEFALASSIFTGTGNTERLFDSAPADTPAYVVACYRDLHAAMKLTAPAARLAAAKKAEACLTEFDSPHMVVQAAAMLGDLDKAFDVIATPEKANLMMRYYYAPWFMPATGAMRADARFLPLMEKLGYVDYWRESKTHPDICDTSSEKDVPLCVALATSEPAPSKP